MTRERFGLLLVALAILLGWLPVHAQSVDPHALYESRCTRCHEPHASEFARAQLKTEGDIVIGTETGEELSALLDGHRGTNLTTVEIRALVDHFAAMMTTGWIYQKKCTLCHEPAVKLARIWLIMRDGRLMGRYTGRDIEVFLGNHGRLTAEEVQIVTKMLQRQLGQP